MHKLKIFKNKTLLSLLLLFGISGSVFFLPIHLDSKYTCLYHQFFNNENPVHKSEIHHEDQDNDQYQLRSAGHGMNSHGEEMLNMYISHYAFSWWSSLALAAFSIYQLINLYKLKKIR